MKGFGPRREQPEQITETFLNAALLSASGGLQDAYTYLARGGVFANAQTGNVVLLSQSLFAGDWAGGLRYLIPVLSFALGVAAAETIRFRFRKGGALRWRRMVLLAEIALLCLVSLTPRTLDLPANAVVSFSCAMQVQAFRKVDGYPFASTMCIGNLRGGVESLCLCFQEGDRKALRRAGRYFGVILLFGLGAGLGSVLLPVWGLRTILASCGLLLISLVLISLRH